MFWLVFISRCLRGKRAGSHRYRERRVAVVNGAERRVRDAGATELRLETGGATPTSRPSELNAVPMKRSDPGLVVWCSLGEYFACNRERNTQPAVTDRQSPF